MKDLDLDLEECVPIKTDVHCSLATEEVYDLLLNASGKHKGNSSSCTTEGWCHFLYNLGENAETWELKKKQIRLVHTFAK